MQHYSILLSNREFLPSCSLVIRLDVSVFSEQEYLAAICPLQIESEKDNFSRK